MSPLRVFAALALTTWSASALAGPPPTRVPVPVPAAPLLAPGFHAVSCGIDGVGATRAAAMKACEAAVRADRWVNHRSCACARNADVIEIAPDARPDFWLAGWTYKGRTPLQAWARCLTDSEGEPHWPTAEDCRINSAWGPFTRRRATGEFDDETRYRWLLSDGSWVDEAGEGPCFTGDTPVLTPVGLRPIAAIGVGDAVVSWSPDGVGVASDVTARVVRVKERAAAEVLALTLVDGRVLRATPNHPLYSVARGDFVPAGELVVGESLAVRGEDGALVPVPLAAVAHEPGPVVVYDLTVTPTHTLFAAGVWAHNY